MRKIINAIITITTCFILSIHGYAVPIAAAKAMAEADNRFFISEDKIGTYNADSFNEYHQIFKEVFYKTFRYAMYPGNMAYEGEYYYSLIDENDKDVIEEHKFTAEWARATAPLYALNGMSKEEAFGSLYSYVLDNINYDYEASDNTVRAGRTMKFVIENKLAACGGYSSLIRSLFEETRFNEAGFVDWEDGDCYVSVAIIISQNNHAWNAVRLEDEWRFYDGAQTVPGCYTRCNMDLKTITGKYAYAYGDPSAWTWNY